MTALRLHSRCRDEKQAHYLWVLGIKLNSGHLDLWTVGKAHKTARISQRPGRGGSKFWQWRWQIFDSKKSWKAEMAMHLISLVCALYSWGVLMLCMLFCELTEESAYKLPVMSLKAGYIWCRFEDLFCTTNPKHSLALFLCSKRTETIWLIQQRCMTY